MPYLFERISLFLFVTILLAGCNAFGGLKSESNDPAVLLQDADAALQDDHPAEAVDYLRKAVDQKGEDEPAPVLRTRLSTALLEKQDLSLIDFARIADKINNKLDSGSDGFASKAAGDRVCNFPSSQASEEFDPTDISNFRKLEGSEGTLQEVQQLVNRVLNTTDTDADSFVNEDIQQTVEDLSNQGVTDEEIAEALVNDAVAYSALAYMDIAQSGGDEFSFYYVMPPSGDQYMGYCSPDQETLDDVLSSVACQVDNIGFAVDLIGARASLLESDRADDIYDEAHDAFGRLTEELGATCPASSQRSLAFNGLRKSNVTS